MSDEATTSIRLPAGMRPAIARAARENHVSANAEICRRIMIEPSETVVGPLDVRRGDDGFLLRLHHDDIAAVRAAAHENQRSLTSEIVRRLASSLDADGIRWRAEDASSDGAPDERRLEPSSRFTTRRGDAQFKFRLPAETLNQLHAAASASGRTMNAELLSRLASTFETGGSIDLSEVLGSIDARLKRLEDR